LRLAGESAGEQQGESQDQLAQKTRVLWEEQARSGEAMKRILEELGGLGEAQMESDRPREGWRGQRKGSRAWKQRTRP
jgi:hypothetical protein